MQKIWLKSLFLLNIFLVVFPFKAGAQFTFPASSGLPTGELDNIFLNVMNWLLGILGVVGVIGFVIAGIFYLTAAGNEDQMKKGKNAMTWSIIGVIVGLMGYVIIQAVDKMLRATAGF
ncbi:MAG: pilin [Candidatus Moraniibacteriota bacterium]